MNKTPLEIIDDLLTGLAEAYRVDNQTEIPVGLALVHCRAVRDIALLGAPVQAPVEPDPDPEPIKKRKQKRDWSPAQRAAAAERMRTRMTKRKPLAGAGIAVAGADEPDESVEARGGTDDGAWADDVEEPVESVAADNVIALDAR